MFIENPGRIKVFLKDGEKKNLLQICKEVIVLMAVKKELPLYYFKYAYKKTVRNYRDYLGAKLCRQITFSKRLHQQEYISILENKLTFSLYCERNGIPTPALVGHNFKGSFYTGRGLKNINSLQEMVHLYERIFNATDVEALFFRPLTAYGGAGCFRLDRNTFAPQLAEQYDNLMRGDYIHTEVIPQHTSINRIYDKSINTLRIMTHNDGQTVEVTSSFMRFGAGGNVVDNSSVGGLSVGIVQNTGSLQKSSYIDMEFGGGGPNKHPDTGFIFEGFKIPYFEEACTLAKYAAGYIPNGFIGWDIAITPTGPVLIEGNENPGLFVADVLYGGLMRNDKMLKVVERK